MKVIFALAALVAVASAAPQSAKDAVIVKSNSDNIGVDGYNFDFETSNGIVRSEQGVLTGAGTDKEAIAVKGSVKWTDVDGTPYQLDFVADENGYQPVGAHLPK